VNRVPTPTLRYWSLCATGVRRAGRDDDAAVKPRAADDMGGLDTTCKGRGKDGGDLTGHDLMPCIKSNRRSEPQTSKSDLNEI